MTFRRKVTSLRHVGGDFNVLRQDEHVEVGQRTQAQIRGFREAVDECGLCDLWYVGEAGLLRKKLQEVAIRESGWTGP
jgi:hypothetical protein